MTDRPERGKTGSAYCSKGGCKDSWEVQVSPPRMAHVCQNPEHHVDQPERCEECDEALTAGMSPSGKPTLGCDSCGWSWDAPTDRPKREVDWTTMEVWSRGNGVYICHRIDGDDCIGPFPDGVTAQRILDALRTLTAERHRLEAENERLREDAERLDWLEAQGGFEVEDYVAGPKVVTVGLSYEHEGDTLREAIDAARALEPETEE